MILNTTNMVKTTGVACKILNRWTGKFLDYPLVANNYAAGAQLLQWSTGECIDANYYFTDPAFGSRGIPSVGQIWRIAYKKDTNEAFINLEHSFPLFLDVRAGSVDNGAAVQTYLIQTQVDWVDAENTVTTLPVNQTWTFENVSDAPGWYYIKNNVSGKYLDLVGPSVENGTLVHQWEKGPQQVPSNQWAIVRCGVSVGENNEFMFMNENSRKFLDVAGWSRSDGASVLQWLYTGGANQRWTLNQNSVVSVNSGKNLDISGESTNDGAPLIQWRSNGQNNQKWLYHQDPSLGSPSVVDNYLRCTLRSVMINSKCVDIGGWSTENGTVALSWSVIGGENQKFYVLDCDINKTLLAYNYII
jgi:hypothetical protein